MTARLMELAGADAQAQAAIQEAASPKTFRLENRTAYRIVIVSSDAQKPSLVLPPFGYRDHGPSVVSDYPLAEWLTTGLVSLADASPRAPSYTKTDAWRVTQLLIGYAAATVPIVVILSAFIPADVKEFALERWWIAPVFAAAVLAFVWGPVALGDTNIRARSSDFMEAVVRALTLIFVLAVGVGMPAVVILYFGGLGSLFDWMRTAPALGVLGRTFQGVFAAIAAILPALLYFMFRRQRLESLRTTFLRDLLMLDGGVKTLDEAQSKYGHLFDETYGARRAPALGADLPVILSTLLIAFGWTLTLLPVGAVDPNIYKLFNPPPEPFIFAFLGAYFFGLNMVFLRYVRSDLTPKAYSHITVRILVAEVLVWVIGALSAQISGQPASGTAATSLTLGPLEIGMAPLAFVIGIFPQTGITLLAKRLGNELRLPFSERHPLTDLDGVNAYDQARLIEEGVDNVENLAQANFIELMLHTRVPTPRLVDLVDQAILYLHLSSEADALQADRQRLRRYGIRTATNLLYAATWDAERSEWSFNSDAPIWQILETTAGDPQGKSRLRLIYDSLVNDDWLAYLWRWRTMNGRDADTIRSPEEALKISLRALAGAVPSAVAQPALEPTTSTSTAQPTLSSPATNGTLQPTSNTTSPSVVKTDENVQPNAEHATTAKDPTSEPAETRGATVTS